MYGIVNKAIKEVFVEKNGIEAWDEITSLNNFPNHFLSNDNHPDEMTFSMVEACCNFETCEMSEFLVRLGRHWILSTSQKYFDKLIPKKNLKKFIKELPSFHSRVMLIYRDISPPEFEIIELDNNTLQIDYYSSRLGLDYFMLGLLEGLVAHFEEYCDIEILSTKNNIKEPTSFNLKFVKG